MYSAHDVIRENRADGSIVLRARAPLGPVANRITDWLDHWAEATPDAVFLAERSGPGWRELTYAAARDEARALAGGLLSLGLGPDRPIVILSGNSVDHGLLTLAGAYSGVPVVPVAEQYSLIPGARTQLDTVAALVSPGMVYAEDGTAHGEGLARPCFGDAVRVVSQGDQLTLADLAKRGGDITAAHAAVGPETVAKFLLTSGSTSSPKAVPTTHGMQCANQAQIAQGLPFLQTRPPVIVDWLPWNHVFGGSHNFNLMLANGGSLYIDGGKPAPHLVGQTLENLRLKTGTLAFNVPVGFALLRDAMRTDADLRHRFFQDLDMLFYAGASLPQDVWADLEAMAREVRGTLPLFTSSWGLTETAPAVLLQHEPTQRSGIVGVPLPGAEVKLIPADDGRFEVRVRGPNIFSGYHRDPAKTADAFDEEGFFRTGDAMAFVDDEDPNLGLRFDGRLSEDFKLTSGTWVRAATLRLTVLGALKGLAQDVVITGADRGEVGLLIIPAPTLTETAQPADGALVTSQAATIVDRLSTLTGGSAARIARALVLADPPDMGAGEITAKGNLNFSKLLKQRAELVERLYRDDDPATILIPKP